MDEPGNISRTDQTAFDALIEKMKSDALEDEHKASPAVHVSRLSNIFEAAMREVTGGGEDVASRLHAEGEKVHEQMKAHPVATVSSAFAAGYFVGKAIAGRARK